MRWRKRNIRNELNGIRYTYGMVTTDDKVPWRINVKNFMKPAKDGNHMRKM